MEYKSYKLTVGVEYTKNGQPLSDVYPSPLGYDPIRVFRNLAADIIIGQAGGFTLTEGTGGYTHENGDTVIERCLIVEVVTNSRDVACDIGRQLRLLYHQESVLLIGPDGSATFIGGSSAR